MKLLSLLLLLLQPAPPTVMVTPEGQALRVEWSAGEVVCPWLEWGSVRVYAGGDEPCRASGTALVTVVPDAPARVVLRTAEGREVAGVGVEWTAILPLVVVAP